MAKTKNIKQAKNIKHRNIFLVYLFTIITFGIYGIYWLISTKNEINRLGAKIPTAWLIIIPIANLYWAYKYCEGFAHKVKKDDNTVLWFILYVLVGIVMPAIVQSELNKLANK
ncbi:MAG TPA: DUF4234 domain-containing protein [Candidatus Nanoarchaeia archaeon]|nr:DUF4234 domain-containing protein [Candidatus Nanoarchaeia archaeon]